MTVIVGIDLGSRRIGCVAAHEGLPLHVLVADTVEVPVAPRGRRLDLRPVVDQLVARVLACQAHTVVIEHGAFYSPAGMSSAEAARRAQAHEVCSNIEAGLYRELTDAPDSAEEIAAWAGALPSRLPRLITIPRATWVHRVVPHTSGGIDDDTANEHMRPHIAEGWEKLDGKHQDKRDAAGAIVGWLLPAPRKSRKPRVARTGNGTPPPRPVRTQEEKIAKRRADTIKRVHRCRGTLPLEALAAKGCLCFVDRPRRVGRHKAGCPVAPPPKSKATKPSSAARST